MPITLAAATALGAGLSSGSSALSSWQTNRQMRKYLKAQAVENQKARDFNQQMAEQQNTWNAEQWQRQVNAYQSWNDPSSQVARLRGAGLNPDLAYSGGSVAGAGSLPSSAPAVSSGYGNPLDYSAMMQKRTVGDTIQDSLNKMMQLAQIKNIDADTDNKNTENDIKGETLKGLNTDNLYKALLYGQQLQLNSVDIQFKDSQVKLSNAQVDKVYKEVEKIDNECSLINEQLNSLRVSVEGMTYDNVVKKIDSVMHSDIMKAQLSQLYQNLKQSKLNYSMSENQFLEQISTFSNRLLLSDMSVDAAKLNLGDMQINYDRNKMNYVIDCNQRSFMMDNPDFNHPASLVFNGIEFFLKMFGKVIHE